LVFSKNFLYDSTNVLNLLFSVGYELTLTFAASTKVHGNEVDFLEGDLKTFEFMTSIAVKVEYGRVEYE
jgi:hypothetical protein